MNRERRARAAKRIKRGPGAWSAWVGLVCYCALLKAIPVSWISAVGCALGWLMYRFMGPRRRIALENLKIALGRSTDPSGRRDILRSLARNLGTTVAELGHPRYLRAEVLRRHVGVQGLDRLNQALTGGRGAILVTAHFGNFPLLLARLASEGYRLGVIVRDPRHRPAARFLDDWRARIGVMTVKDKPRWSSVKESLSLLRSNGVLVLHIDLNVSQGGLYVPFFRQWVPTFQGPALLSLRTGAPVLFTFIRRVHAIHHRLTIEEPVLPPKTGDPKEDGWRLLWALTHRTEGIIREHPQEWWWIHRRFRKARPAAEVGRPLPDFFA